MLLLTIDIVDGSLKAAMRVVVAIADQFLPTSVRRVQPMSRPRAYTESSPSTGSQRGSSVSPNCTLNRSTGEPPQKSPSPITQLMTTTLGRNNHLPFNIHRRSYTPEMRPDSPIYSTPIDCIEGSSGEIAEGTRRPSLGRKKGRDSFNTEKQMLVLEELAQSQTEVMDMKNQMLQLFALVCLLCACLSVLNMYVYPCMFMCVCLSVYLCVYVRQPVSVCMVYMGMSPCVSLCTHTYLASGVCACTYVLVST